MRNFSLVLLSYGDVHNKQKVALSLTTTGRYLWTTAVLRSWSFSFLHGTCFFRCIHTVLNMMPNSNKKTKSEQVRARLAVDCPSLADCNTTADVWVLFPQKRCQLFPLAPVLPSLHGNTGTAHSTVQPAALLILAFPHMNTKMQVLFRYTQKHIKLYHKQICISSLDLS